MPAWPYETTQNNDVLQGEKTQTCVPSFVSKRTFIISQLQLKEKHTFSNFLSEDGQLLVAKQWGVLFTFVLVGS